VLVALRKDRRQKGFVEGGHQKTKVKIDAYTSAIELLSLWAHIISQKKRGIRLTRKNSKPIAWTLLVGEREVGRTAREKRSPKPEDPNLLLANSPNQIQTSLEKQRACMRC